MRMSVGDNRDDVDVLFHDSHDNFVLLLCFSSFLMGTLVCWLFRAAYSKKWIGLDLRCLSMS